MIWSGSKCCHGNRERFGGTVGQSPWSFSPLSFTPPLSPLCCNPTISSGQESGFFKSRKWLMEQYFTDYCRSARGWPQSDMISYQSGERCAMGLRGLGGRPRKSEWSCFALSYYSTLRCWQWNVPARSNHAKYPTWHFSPSPPWWRCFSFSSLDLYLLPAILRRWPLYLRLESALWRSIAPIFYSPRPFYFLEVSCSSSVCNFSSASCLILSFFPRLPSIPPQPSLPEKRWVLCCLTEMSRESYIY